MKKTGISILYFIIGVICIVLQNQPSFYPGFFSKVMIIPVLIIFFLLNLRLSLNRLHILMFAGLIFSWAGDVILEFSGTNANAFVIGLVCFLFAHLMYFTVFLLTPGKNAVIGKGRWLLIPVAIYGIILIIILYGDLAEMKLPVIVYAVVILAMLSGAINRKEKVNLLSYYLVLGGAILFVISDSSIAISKFSYKFPHSGAVIMSTYIAAQYLIITGYIAQRDNAVKDQVSL